MSRKPLTVPNLIEVVTQTDGTISTSLAEYTIILSTGLSEVSIKMMLNNILNMGIK